MERINPMVSCDISTNWANNNGTRRNGKDSGTLFINGTPGAKNSVAP